jgi:hypothetical protein
MVLLTMWSKSLLDIGPEVPVMMNGGKALARVGARHAGVLMHGAAGGTAAEMLG